MRRELEEEKELNWQPIETCPKRTGHWVLLKGGETAECDYHGEVGESLKRPVVGMWTNEIDWAFAYWDGGWRSGYENPTHWAEIDLLEDAEASPPSERQDTIRALRKIGEEIGANDWPDDLPLSEIIEKHLYPLLGLGEKTSISPGSDKTFAVAYKIVALMERHEMGFVDTMTVLSMISGFMAHQIGQDKTEADRERFIEAFADALRTAIGDDVSRETLGTLQ